MGWHGRSGNHRRYFRRLVGEVTDEHDRAEEEPQQIAADTWVVPARLGLDDLAELVNLEVDDDEVDTVGGLLAKALGKVPLVGSKAKVAGMELRVKSVSGSVAKWIPYW